MSRLVQNIPATDPLMNAEKKVVIDRILTENLGKDGAITVALNELQSQWNTGRKNGKWRCPRSGSR